MKKKALLCFTKDLRIQDNAMIHWASIHDYEVVALAFEPLNRSEFQKKLYLKSAIEIQEKFKNKGISFLILKGRPEVEITRWVECNRIDKVLIQDSYNTRDQKVVSKIKANLKQNQLKTFYDRTLIDQNDLPFSISELPNVFTDFRKAVESSSVIRKPLVSEFEKLLGFSVLIPENTIFCDLSSAFQKTSFAFNIDSTETASLNRIEDYFFTTGSLSNYKTTRNGLLEKNDSSKLSVGLAHGSISARHIYAEVIKFEEGFGANESTKWFKFELLWRDYFKFLSLKIGDQLFNMKGLKQNIKSWSTDPDSFQRWCNGNTGSDFVDANMIELKYTGWMSNRGRQNTASYLSKNLNINWTLGAQYFENNLIDDDAESNWGNWLYISGVGTDPRDRLFNVQRQADIYDLQLSYRKKWLALENRTPS